MSALLFLLLCYNVLDLSLGEYDAPRSAQYPFGDEAFNSDMREDRVQEEAREISIELIKDIYTFCPNITTEDENEEIPYSDNKCAKCDVRPTVDKRGVLVECFNCTDAAVLLAISDEETPPDHILYLANYLEIANYSAPPEEEEEGCCKN